MWYTFSLRSRRKNGRGRGGGREFGQKKEDPLLPPLCTPAMQASIHSACFSSTYHAKSNIVESCRGFKFLHHARKEILNKMYNQNMVNYRCVKWFKVNFTARTLQYTTEILRCILLRCIPR